MEQLELGEWAVWSNPNDWEKPKVSELTVGIKHDEGKLRYDLVPPTWMEGDAKVLTHGATKYSDNNWKNVEPTRYVAATFRHLIAYLKGEQFDKETGYHHLYHARTNLGFLVSFDEGKNE